MNIPKNKNENISKCMLKKKKTIEKNVFLYKQGTYIF